MEDHPIFLTLSEVLEIHKNQIEIYGGKEGVRDLSLLMSAIAMPETSFQGEYLHLDLFEMAAAYAYYICMNHPFVDGNKRVGLVAALVFLDFNGVEIDDSEGILYDAMMKVASSEKKKDFLSDIFRHLSPGVKGNA